MDLETKCPHCDQWTVSDIESCSKCGGLLFESKEEPNSFISSLKKNRKLAIGLAVAVLILSVFFRKTDLSGQLGFYGQWDKNKDGYLNGTEIKAAMTELNKVEMNVIDISGESRVVKFRWEPPRMDMDLDQRLSREELKQDDRRYFLFQEYDLDKDGLLSKAEIEKAPSAVDITGTPRKRVPFESLKKFDLNQDGKLALLEIPPYHSYFGTGMGGISRGKERAPPRGTPPSGGRRSGREDSRGSRDQSPKPTADQMKRIAEWRKQQEGARKRGGNNNDDGPTAKSPTVLWEFETGDDVRFSPAVGHDGTVYVGSTNRKVYALDGKTGAKKWEFKTGANVLSSTAIGSDGTVYVGSNDNKLYAINGSTGVKQWEFKTGGGVHSPPAIGADGTVYVGSDDRKLYAINGRTGVKKWEFKTGGPVTSSPAIGPNGIVYFGSADDWVYALNRATGAKKWEFKMEDGLVSSPTIGVYGTVYVGSADKKVYALSLGPGVKVWEFETGGKVSSSPAIGSDGTVYLGEKGGNVYALDGKSGAKKWEFQIGDNVDSSPAIGADGTVYVNDSGGNVYALDGKSGVKLWEFETGDYVYSSPAIGSDGTVYVGSGEKVYALKAPNPNPPQR